MNDDSVRTYGRTDLTEIEIVPVGQFQSKPPSEELVSKPTKMAVTHRLRATLSLRWFPHCSFVRSIPHTQDIPIPHQPIFSRLSSHNSNLLRKQIYLFVIQRNNTTFCSPLSSHTSNSIPE